MPSRCYLCQCWLIDNWPQEQTFIKIPNISFKKCILKFRPWNRRHFIFFNRLKNSLILSIIMMPSRFRTWTSNYIHSFKWDGITHPDFNGGLIKQPWHGWLIASNCFTWMYLLIHAPSLMLAKLCTVKATPGDTICLNGPLARYVKLRVTHAPGMPGTFSSPPWVSDPDMHHGTCMTHVPWCMLGSLASGFLWSRWRGNVPGIPGACATRAVLRIWYEAHRTLSVLVQVMNA